MKISVIVPAYNASGTLAACIESIRSQSMDHHELIVVDDCSEDGTAELAEKLHVIVVRSSNRGGPASARNAGAARATGEVLLFLDSDVTVPDDLLVRIDYIFRSKGDISAVQTIYSPCCASGDLVSVYQNFYYHHALAHLHTRSVAIFATWCAAIRRKDFFEAGGFNTRIPEPTVEDEELGYSLADAGKKIYLAREIMVTHLAQYTLGQFARRRYRMAKAQAKSGWRSVRDRLLRRYINIRETGTHHSRWVVLSILLVMMAGLLMLSAAGTLAAGWTGWRFLAPAALVSLVLSLSCHLRFFRSAASHLGKGVIPGFILMSILDMAVLGCGIVAGSFRFAMGERY